jgi:hypothetical protein
MKALIIVDMLKDFVEDWGALKVNGAKTIIPYIKELKDQFKRKIFRLSILPMRTTNMTKNSLSGHHIV